MSKIKADKNFLKRERSERYHFHTFDKHLPASRSRGWQNKGSILKFSCFKRFSSSRFDALFDIFYNQFQCNNLVSHQELTGKISFLIFGIDCLKDQCLFCRLIIRKHKFWILEQRASSLTNSNCQLTDIRVKISDYIQKMGS